MKPICDHCGLTPAGQIKKGCFRILDYRHHHSNQTKYLVKEIVDTLLHKSCFRNNVVSKNTKYPVIRKPVMYNTFICELFNESIHSQPTWKNIYQWQPHAVYRV